MYKVLIVEDDPMVAMINEQYVERHEGFEVAGVCRDGAQALAFLQKRSVDLLILDVYMPRIDGFDTLRRLRIQKTQVDVIMVTAADDRASLEEALRLGVVDYLVKPFTFERFQMALEKFIAQHTALQDLSRLSQQRIDSIVDPRRRSGESPYPKGIQESTLGLILDSLHSRAGQWLTGDSIAAATGLTVVTVRRYMRYLAESGRITEQMNYETGGRPCMVYRFEANKIE